MIKKYIWTNKFKSATLTIVGLKGYLRVCLNELKNIYEIKDKANLFDKWINLYSDLCQEDEDAGNLVHTPVSLHPTPVLDLLIPADPTPPVSPSQTPAQLGEGDQDHPGG